MSLLRQSQDATIATDEPLAAVLRRAKILAVRLDNPLLGGCVDHELGVVAALAQVEVGLRGWGACAVGLAAHRGYGAAGRDDQAVDAYRPPWG